MKFADGEKVLCFHGPLLYEAKALKSQVTKDKQVKYFIHYAGWNKNWDEWVPENRVLKYNEANCQRQKEVSKLHATAAKNKKSTVPKPKKSESQASTSSDSRASTPSKEVVATKESTPATPASNAPSTPAATVSRSRGGSKSTAATTPATVAPEPATPVAAPQATETPEPPATPAAAEPTPVETSAPTAASSSTSAATSTATKKKTRGQRQDTAVESEEAFLSKVEVKIKIPDELKPWLVDDWDAITRLNRLIELPAKVTVQEIVNHYVAHKKLSKTSTASKESAITDVANGIVDYFDVMLGSQLLYKFERPQYADQLLQNPDKPMSQLYGAHHLLRLFVKLGSMLAFTTLDDKSVNVLVNHLSDFLKFLVKNSSCYFSMTNYVNADQEYHRNAL